MLELSDNKRLGLLISPELCTGCLACQCACKAWNGLEPDPIASPETKMPTDLDSRNLNRINAIVLLGEQKIQPIDWLFVSRRCMHCAEAGCMQACPAPGALVRTQYGAVVPVKACCIGCGLCQAGCPFDVPRFDGAGLITKCHLCHDRIEQGMPPACAKACPTGAIKYSNRKDLLESAGNRALYGVDALGGLGVIYSMSGKRSGRYGLPDAPAMPVALSMVNKLLKPLAAVALAGAAGAALVHYLTIGPMKDSGEGGQDER